MSFRRRFGAAFTVMLACGTSGCIYDEMAYAAVMLPGKAALPGTVSFALLGDACGPGGLLDVCSRERVLYNSDIEIADPVVVQQADVSSEWGTEIDWMSGIALRAMAPGESDFTLTAHFSDGTTRSATGTLDVIAPEFVTVEPKNAVGPSCERPRETLNRPASSPAHLTVLVDEELPLLIRAWGMDRYGYQVHVNGLFDVPPHVRTFGASHTLTVAPRDMPWETRMESLVVHEPGEVEFESALDAAWASPLAVKAVAESRLAGVEPFFPWTAPLRVGRNQLVRAVPRDDEGVFCGGARFKARLTVTSLTPEHCLLGSSLYDSGVASSFTPRDAEFYIVPIAPGMCRYRMSLPDLPRRARSVHEARVYTADDPLNDGGW